MRESAQRSAGWQVGEWGALTAPGVSSARVDDPGIRLATGTPLVSVPEAVSGAARPGQKERLVGALLCLPEEERQVLILRLFQGLSCEAIGRQIGQSAVMVRGTQSRALSRLRAIVDGEAPAS